MSLTGHIDVFPLEEVLRLLARSYKSGCLRVDAPDVHGRVFINGGSVTFATVGTDDDLRRQLLSARVVTEDALRNAEVGGRSLTDSANTTEVAEFFREEVIESLYRIRKPGRGQFVFNVDVTPRYQAEQSFEVEMCISEADRRAMEWADIESVLPTVEDSLRVVGSAPNNEPVTLAPNTWKLIAELRWELDRSHPGRPFGPEPLPSGQGFGRPGQGGAGRARPRGGAGGHRCASIHT